MMAGQQQRFFGQDYVMHNYLVDVLVTSLERNGYDVHARLPHYAEPPQLAGHQPDVYAIKAESPTVIGSAKLQSRLHDQQTRQQWQAFAAGASRADNIQFCVIVPSNCLDDATGQAAAWGVTVNGFYTEQLAERGVQMNDRGLLRMGS
jgi:hypothetical protein